MRRLFHKKLEANNGIHRAKMKNNKYSRSFPCGRVHEKITWYTFTVDLIDGSHVPDFSVSHYFGNKCSDHRLSDEAIMQLSDLIIEEYNRCIEAFIYGEEEY
jgi:hypothetical protein